VTDITENGITGASFAPGSSADHPYGVLYQGEYQNVADGTGIAVRLHSKALAATGIPVLLKSISSSVIHAKGYTEPLHSAGLHPDIEKEVGSLTQTSIGITAPRIKHLVVRSADALRKTIMRGAVGPLEDPDELMEARKIVYGQTILYTVWERDRISDELVSTMSRIAENWVPCEQNAEMLRKAGVSNVQVIPHPFDPADDVCKLTRRRTSKEKRFYHIGRWEPRKGQAELLLAYLRAYAPGEAYLTLKYHGGKWDGYPEPHEAITSALADAQVGENGWTRRNLDAGLKMIEGHLRRDQILRLHFTNNIYVSASHGEAWNLPAFEAKLAGNRLVYVAYGGERDFAEPAADLAIVPIMESVHASYGWEKDAKWAGYTMEMLENALRLVKPPEAFYRHDGMDKFTIAAVGKLMKERVLAVAAKNVKASAYYATLGG
jgi:glycosyltransferase involved in cell wall biosynthesis